MLAKEAGMRLSPWLFWPFALTASAFFGLFPWRIFPVQRPDGPWKRNWPWYVYQAWFNFIGSLTGWYALWALRSSWGSCLTSECSLQVTWGGALHGLVALAGIAGQLPWALSLLIGGFIGGVGAVSQAAASTVSKHVG